MTLAYSQISVHSGSFDDVNSYFRKTLIAFLKGLSYNGVRIKKRGVPMIG